MGATNEIDECVSENSDLLDRVLAFRYDEVRAYALALVPNSRDPTRVDDVNDQLDRIPVRPSIHKTLKERTDPGETYDLSIRRLMHRDHIDMPPEEDRDG